MRIAALAFLVIGGLLFVLSNLYPKWVSPAAVQGNMNPEEAEMLIIEAGNLKHAASIPGEKVDTTKLEEAKKILADAKKATEDAEAKRQFGKRIFRYGALGTALVGVICYCVAKVQEG